MNVFFCGQTGNFDNKLNTVGYELLFRDSMVNRFPDVSSEQATTQLIEEQFFGAPVGRKDENNSVYVNFPHQLLVDGLAETLPKDRVIIEILETASPDHRLLETVKRMQTQGFRIALDDFSLSSEWDAFIPYINIIKFDIQKNTREEIAAYIGNKREMLHHAVFLAEKVESYDEFEAYKKMGFHPFRAIFSANP
jgi:EAL and modified HD-GYP domain-containing signal transduction protein